MKRREFLGCHISQITLQHFIDGGNFEVIEERKRKIEKIKEDIKIPLDVFKQGIGAAESLTKYIKENKELRLNEISKLINRDQRNIWTLYSRAVKKIS